MSFRIGPRIHDFARFSNLRSAVVFGSVGYGNQMDTLRDGVDVLVETPSRLLDHMQRGTCKLDRIKFVVLDEADRILNMGFLPDVRRILDRCPRVKLENFDYCYTALFEEGKPGHPQGGGERVCSVRVRGGCFYGPARRRR